MMTFARMALLVAIAASPLLGQDKSKYYTVMHPGDFSIDWTGFYARIDRMTAETREEFPHHLDLAFGTDAKQKLDLYLPKGKVEGAPVFLFLHGGGFREGDRAHYGFVARPFLKNNIITAVASYRLTSGGAHYPDQPVDVEMAVKWIFQNIGKYGGDKNQIYVGGHSAGAILSAFVALRSDWRAGMGLPADVIKGIAPVSGPYDLRPGAYEERAGEADAYVKEALREEASPIAGIQTVPARAVVAIGSVEEAYMSSSRALVKELNARGSKAELLILEGQDHAQTALSLGEEGSELFQAVLTMIRP